MAARAYDHALRILRQPFANPEIELAKLRPGLAWVYGEIGPLYQIGEFRLILDRRKFAFPGERFRGDAAPGRLERSSISLLFLL